MNTTGELKGFHGEVYELDQKYFPWPWKKEDWESLDDYKKLYGLNVSGKIKGFCLIHHVDGDNTLHLLKIILDPELRGTQISQDFWKSLIHEFKKFSEKVFLEVESTNQRAIGFYQKMGFLPLRVIKGYYSNGSDGLSMELTL